MARVLIMIGFYLAAIAHIGGALLFSYGFNNPLLTESYPVVFSDFGLVLMMLWGLNYLAVAHVFYAVRWLLLVFVFEAIAYVASWVMWLYEYHGAWQSIYDQDELTGLFLVGYGVVNLIFAMFFLYVFARTKRFDTRTDNPPAR